MPLIDENELLNITQSGITETPKVDPLKPQETIQEKTVQEETKETGFIDAAKAFFSLEDVTFNVAKEFFGPSNDDSQIDRDFDPISRIEQERPDLLDNVNDFVEVRNEKEFNEKLFKVDYENEQKEILSKAPTLTAVAAGIAASVVDPTVLIPYVGTASKVSRLANIAKGAAIGLGVGAGTSVLREGILQGTQETRTVSDSTINIVAESVLGGIIGAGAGALADPVKRASKQILGKALQGEDFKINVSETGELSVARDLSAGAAEKLSELDSLGLARINENLAKVLSGPEALRSPDLRAILSPSETVRKLGEVFYNSNYIRNKNLEGVASGPKAQNAIFRREQTVTKNIKEVDSLYLQYTGTGQFRAAVARPEGKISSREFSDRVWRNLVDSERVDDIVEVNKASKLLRADMDKMAKELQAAKLLPEDLDPKFMANYMSRVYDTQKLLNPQARARFITKVGNWIQTHNKDGSLRTVKLDRDVAESEADKILDTIRGETDQQIALSSVAEGFITKGKFLKERQLLIPDEEIAEFLDTDSVRLYKNYMLRASKLIETQKALERAGFDSFQDALQQIKMEADRAVQGAGGIDKDILKLGKDFKSAEDLANMMYRSMLGQLRKPGAADRFAETLLNYQFVRLLGGVTISSLPELAMIPFRQGFLKTLKYGYVPMLRSMKTAKLSKNQLNDLTGALEFEQSNVLRALGGIDDADNLGRSQTTWDRYQEFLTSSFVKASGIGYFTSFERRLAAQVSAADIVRTIKAGPKGKDVERLAVLGISKENYAKLARQIDEHVQEYKGSYVVNPHLWKDQEALELLQNAIQTEVESAILKPGVEALPFFVQQSQMAKVLFQFKSFMSAATGKVTISGIQRRDANVITGLMGLIAMGSLSELAHDKLAGRDVDLAPEELLLSGLSRSGVLGLIGTTVLDTARTLSNEKISRFGGKFVSSNILGPSAGQIEEIVRVMQGVTDGNVTDKDKKAALRMIPFMNLFYIKAITERAFDEK